MNISELYDINYWFALRPGEMSFGFILFFLVVFLLVFLSTFAVIAYKKREKESLTKPQKKLFGRIQSACSTMGLLGLLWLFFAYEQVPFLSVRFWVIIWALSAGFWIYIISRFISQEMKPQLQQMAEKERIEKWLPKKSS